MPKNREFLAQMEQNLIDLIARYQNLLSKVQDWLNNGSISGYSIALAIVEAKITANRLLAAAAKNKLDTTLSYIDATDPAISGAPQTLNWGDTATITVTGDFQSLHGDLITGGSPIATDTATPPDRSITFTIPAQAQGDYQPGDYTLRITLTDYRGSSTVTDYTYTMSAP